MPSRFAAQPPPARGQEVSDSTGTSPWALLWASATVLAEPVRPRVPTGTVVLTAPVGARLSAAAVDVVVVTVPLVVVALLAVRALRSSGVVSDLVSTIALVLWITGTLLYLVVGAGEGQTLGKRVTGIVVVDDRDGAPIGYERGLLRSVVLVALILPCWIGLLSVLVDRQRRLQGWHDKLAHSVVSKGSLP